MKPLPRRSLLIYKKETKMLLRNLTKMKYIGNLLTSNTETTRKKISILKSLVSCNTNIMCGQ